MIKRIKKKLEFNYKKYILVRDTKDHIFNMKNIFGKCREYIDLHACFIDKSFGLQHHRLEYTKIVFSPPPPKKIKEIDRQVATI